jgi:peptide/nickel transport system substrate-binding protein
MPVDSRSSLWKRRAFLQRSGLGALWAALWFPFEESVAATSEEGAESRPWLNPVPPEGGRVILDPAQFPNAFHEAPMLAELVRQGRLAPVHERIGQDPLVIQPLHEIGHYGGTLRRAFIGPSDFWGATRFTTGPDSLLYWDYEWKQVIPNVARAFEMSPDSRTLTISLRRGMRWSDGVPFTADDIMFWYTDMYRDERVVANPGGILQFDGKNVVIEKVDDVTVQFISPTPYPLLPELLAGYNALTGPSLYGRIGMGGSAPKHYLSQFHPKYSSEDQVKRAAKEAGFVSWPLWLKHQNDWAFNRDLPVLSPWKMVSPINSRTFAMERNAYSIWVDSAGNQLPYIDRVSHVFCSRPEIVVLKAVAGSLDFQERHLDITRLPVMLSNRKRSGYDVFIDPMAGTDFATGINIGYKEDAEIGSLFRTTAFRRALSLGLDRDAFNETFMLGMGIPAASVPVPDNKYFPGPQWMHKWATYDVAQANRLLDGIGLTRRDTAGYRLRRDGRGRLSLVYGAPVSNVDYGAVGEMMREQWRDIGIDLDVQVMESTLWMQRCQSGAMQLTHVPTGGEDPMGQPDYLFPVSPTGANAVMGIEYVRWFQSNGQQGEEPPPKIRQMMELWKTARSVGPEERIRIGKEIIKIHVDEVFSIGMLTGGLSFYGIHVAKKNLGNVPRRMVNTLGVKNPLNALPMTFFYKKA